METTSESSLRFVLLACIGGAFVLVGLLMEVFAEKKSFKNINSLRFWKTIKCWGEWSVIFGIVIELIVGAVFANEEWQNEPLNAPINSISAVIKLKVKGVKTVPFNTPGNGIFVVPSSEELMGWGKGGVSFFKGTNLSDLVYNLYSDSEDIEMLGSGLVDGSNDWRGVVVNFHEKNFGDWSLMSPFASSSFKNGEPVKIFNEVGSLIVSLPQMETNVEVVSGIVEVKVNSSRWQFLIPSQNPRFGIITSQIINGAKNETVKVLPVPVANMNGKRLGVYDGK